MLPTSAMRKFSMNMLVDQYMRSKGFTPHNGHGYFRTKSDADTIVTDEYSFVYHEHIYGYDNYDLLGFGIQSVSSIPGYTITNTLDRHKYIEQIQLGNIPCKISMHSKKLHASRPIVLRLPYHGVVEKSKIQLSLISDQMMKKLDELKQNDLVIETDDNYILTKSGWYWYVNIMYYLMPEEEQKCLNAFVVTKLKESDRIITKNEILFNLHNLRQ